MGAAAAIGLAGDEVLEDMHVSAMTSPFFDHARSGQDQGGLAKRVAIVCTASLSGVGLTLKGHIHFCDVPLLLSVLCLAS